MSIDAKLSVFGHFSDPAALGDEKMLAASYRFAKEVIEHGGKVHMEYRPENGQSIPATAFDNLADLDKYVGQLVRSRDLRSREKSI